MNRGWLLLLLFVGAIIYFYKPIKRSMGGRESVEAEETDLDKIKKIAEKKIKDAEKKGIDKLVCESYFNIVRHCPYWIKQKKDNKHIKKIVSYAREGKTNKKDEFTEIILNNKKFQFIYKKNAFPSFLPEHEDVEHDGLELFYKNKRVFAIGVDIYNHYEYPEFGYSDRIPGEIKAFIDGDWIDDLNILKSVSEEDSQENSAKRKIIFEKEEAKKLKKNFGI